MQEDLDELRLIIATWIIMVAAYRLGKQWLQLFWMMNDDSWSNRISQWYYLFSKHFVFQNLFMLKTHYLKVNTSQCSYNSIWHNLLLTLHLESNAFCVCIVYTFMTCLKKWSTIMTNFFILSRYCKNICINKIIKYAEFCHITA